MNTQNNYTTKTFKKIKKSYRWSGMLTTFFFTLLISVLLMLMLSMAASYVLESWAASEYDRIVYMASVYEKNNKIEIPENDLTDRDFVVIDDSGKPVYVYGTNTCTMDGHQVEVAFGSGSRRILVYSDTKNRIIYTNEDTLQINLEKLLSYILSPSGMQEIKGNDVLSFPMWIGVPMSDGVHTFIGKSGLLIDRVDMIFLTAISACIAVLLCGVVFGFIFKFIRGLVNQSRLKTLIFSDEITGGYNWMAFRVKGEPILRKHSNMRNRYAVLDVVFVKYRNYCVCHSVEEGENKLRMVSSILERNMERGEISAHYASANFAALVKANDEEALKARLKALLNELQSIDPIHRIGFHIGVCYVFPAVDKNGNIVRRRETALERDYNNACAARATLDESDDSGIEFFNDKLVEEQRWIDAVQERQYTALNNEEFVVYYQPKYNPSNDKLTGAEALIRWQSPEFGFVPPGRIIPIFEKNGFITEIDHYMIRHVARDQKAWYDRGFDCVPVSVNVSRAHFIEDDLAEQIRDIVDSEGAPHELIEIELTESAFFDDKKALVNTISKLKEYGFAVSMDDFGSGYSSLNSLKDLPLDVLKLDADFFRGNNDGERGEIVISETIRLAQALHMRTVAEGVEIKEQVDFLASQGCDMIQGYFYAKPMPGLDYEQRLTMRGES